MVPVVAPAQSPPHHRVRRRVLLLLAGPVLLLLWVGGDLAVVLIGAEDDHAAPADVILVLGCAIHADCITARADHAAALYQQGLAPMILASGGPAEGSLTEAAVLTAILRQQGVPAAAIVLEDRSQDTIQNITNSRAIMQARGWRTAILVTEPYHINRAALIARDAGLTVYPSPALQSRLWQDPNLRARKVAEDTVSLMLYQVKHLLGLQN